jgi:plasmid stabilization system protein ParE
MKRRVRFQALALRQGERIEEWYEAEKRGLGDEFADTVEEALDRVAQFPMACQIAYRDVRRLVLRRFPYCVYYRVMRNRSSVIAIVHAKRNPANRP